MKITGAEIPLTVSGIRSQVCIDIYLSTIFFCSRSTLYVNKDSLGIQVPQSLSIGFCLFNFVHTINTLHNIVQFQ